MPLNENKRIYNFDYMRLVLAWLVLFGHTYPLFYGSASVNFFNLFMAGDIGYFAVFCFFTISGYLITDSFVRDKKSDKQADSYVESRILRIYPGYIVVIAFAAFIIGPIFSNLSILNYFSHLDVYGHFFGMILRNGGPDLPGLFVSNPYPNAVNGSLWTINLELKLYVLTFILGYVGLLKTKRRATLTILLLILLLPFYKGHYWLDLMPAGLARDILKLKLAYLLGSLALFYKEKLFKSPVYLILLIVINFYLSSVYLMAGTMSYGVLYMGLNGKLKVSKNFKIPDFSYGLYLYAFLIQQTIITAWPRVSFTQHLIFSTIISITAGMASYYFIEKPFLNLRKKTIIYRSAYFEKIKAVIFTKFKLLQKAFL